MNKIIFFITALFIVSTSCQDNLITEQDREGTRGTSISTRGDTDNVCVASWNTQLLDVGDLIPGPQCEGSACDARAIHICNQISELLEPTPDIVNFQEVFEADAAQVLISCMQSNGYQFHTGFDANQVGTHCFYPYGNSESEGSGLITFSKFPIVSTVAEDFEDCYGCVDGAFDCLAEKGVLLTEIEVSPGCTIFNFNTHMDAGRGAADVATRKKQLEQIKNFLAANVPDGMPLMMSGDFNIERDSPEYFTLLQALGGATNTASMAGTVDGITSPANGDKDGRTLDYIFGQNINSATYDVYYQEIECWWEYKEVIKTPIAFDPKDGEPLSLDMWDLDPEGEHVGKTIKTFVSSIMTHKYNDESEIPIEHQDKVRKKCKSVEKLKEPNGQTCRYYLSVSIHVIFTEFEDDEILMLDFAGSYDSFDDIPEPLIDYYVYDCSPVSAVNPSDHNPILSCVEFDCE